MIRENGQIRARHCQSTLTEWCDTSGAPAGFVLTACDDKGTGWKLFGGCQIYHYFALEGSYINWGKVSGSVVSGGVPSSVFAKQQSWGLAAVGMLPLGERFALFGKLGFVSTEQETNTRTGSDNEAHYGLGLKYAFAGNWRLRAEWEATEKLKAELLSIGAEYRF